MGTFYIYIAMQLNAGFSQAGQFIMDFVQINCIPIFWLTQLLILIQDAKDIV